MNKNNLIFAALFAVFALGACDEGDIFPKEESSTTSGKIAKLTARITGIESWSSQYSIVLAGFAEGGTNAIVQKKLLTGHEDETITLNLSNDEIATVELCVTNRLRERVATFASVNVNEVKGDTITLDAGTMDVGMYKTIQDLVFTGTCARCHGLGTKAAGDLNLTEGKSYDQLVNHSARLPENGVRVMPGSTGNSLLHKVIHGDADAGVSFDHSNMIKEQTSISMIDNWITSGAQP